MALSLKAVLIIALLIELLLPHIPVPHVSAQQSFPAQQTDTVSFGNSWSVPSPLWTYNQGFSIPSDWTLGVITLDVTPDFCAGASVAVGWPFQFTGTYPETMVPGTGSQTVDMNLGNSAYGGSNPATCPNSNGQNNIFEAFAGLKANVNVHLKIGPPQLPQLCDCHLWTPWCCIADWIADAVNWLNDNVFSALGSLGIPTSYEHTWPFDLTGALGGPTYMEMAWGTGSSPIEQTIELPSSNIGPDYLCLAPPFIGGGDHCPGLATIGLGVNVRLNPWVGDIFGTPHVDDGGHNFVTTPFEMLPDTPVGAKDMLGNSSPIFELVMKPGEPPGNQPLPVTITIGNLQQHITVDAKLAPTLYFMVLGWDIPQGGISLYTIDAGRMITGNLPGDHPLIYHSQVSAVTPGDLTIADVTWSTLSKGTITFAVDVANIGSTDIQANWKKIAVYEYSAPAGSNFPLLIKLIKQAEISDPLAACCYKNSDGIVVNIARSTLSQPLRGHHRLLFVIDPDSDITDIYGKPEARYDNNYYWYDLALLPDLKPVLTSNPATPRVCDTVTLKADIVNFGEAEASAQGYASYVMYDTTPQGGTVQLVKHTIPPAMNLPLLAPMEMWSATVWSGSLSGVDVTHQITIVVNPDDAVEESDYTNNKYTLTIKVVGSPSCQGAVRTETAQTQQYGSDFYLTPRCYEMTLTQGKSLTCAIDVTLISGTGTQPVTLTLTGLPAHATSSFSPTSGRPSFHSTLTISTTSTTPLGTYTLTLTGAGGGFSHSKTLTLKVTAPASISVPK